MTCQNIPERPAAASKRRKAWLIATAGLFLACAADSPVGIAARNTAAATGGESNFSFSITPGDHSVRVRIARARTQEGGGESVADFMRRVFATADAAGATRLVLDLSATTGGDSFLVVPAVKGVLAREYLAQRGGLIVIVGPNTFSPLQSTARMLERYAQPIFVGRP